MGMITKECAMQIYNLHRQIEASNEIINVLKSVQAEAEKNDQGIEIVRDGWGGHQTIELHVPERFKNPKGSSFSGSRIYQISCSDAILVLENHVVRLNRALMAEQENALNEIQSQ